MTEASHKYPPPELMTIPRWIVADKTGKPLPGTAAKDPAHWMNYDAAYAKLHESPDADRLGFTLFDRPLLAGSRLLCIDLDSAIRDGQIDEWAQRIVDHFDSYTERSPSGNGLHIWIRVGEHAADYSGGKCYVDIPSSEAKKPQVQVLGGQLEIYASVTGDMIEGVPDRIVLVSQEALQWLRMNYPPDAGKSGEAAKTLETGTVHGTAELSDDDIRARLSGKSCELMSGADPTSLGYPGASEGYFAVVCDVLRACRRDGERTERFLLEEAGVYSAGAAPGSVEPEKYAKPEWVHNRVLKATGVSSGERAEFGLLDSGDLEVGEGEELGLLRPSEFRKRFNRPSAFLIDDFLPSCGVVQIYGKEKHGKSLWAMAIAYAVANQDVNTCFGMEVFEHGTVQILVGEDQFGVSGRTRAQELLCKVGSSMNLDEVDIWLSETPADLTSQGGLDRLAKQLRKTRPKLLIIDTQIANARGIDENKTADMAELFANCTKIAHDLDCVVLLVHHMAKTGNSGARGSGVQGGAVIADFQATRDGRTVKLTPRHTKNWEARQQLRGHIVAVEVGEKPNGEPLTAPAIDYRVDLVDSFDEVEEVSVPEPQTEEGVRPEAELQLWTILNGPSTRQDVAKEMHAKGHISSASIDALKRLERALVDAGKLVVNARRGRGGGVEYGLV